MYIYIDIYICIYIYVSVAPFRHEGKFVQLSWTPREFVSSCLGSSQRQLAKVSSPCRGFKLINLNQSIDQFLILHVGVAANCMCLTYRRHLYSNVDSACACARHDFPPPRALFRVCFVGMCQSASDAAHT